MGERELGERLEPLPFRERTQTLTCFGRDVGELERAQARIGNLGREINEYYWDAKVDVTLLELRNLVQVADLIVDCALRREESRGLHYTLDFPDKGGRAENVLANPIAFSEE